MPLDETITANETGHLADHATLKAAYVARGSTAGAIPDLTQGMSASAFATAHRTVHNALATEHNALGAATVLPTNVTAGSAGHLAHQSALHKAHNLRDASTDAYTDVYSNIYGG